MDDHNHLRLSACGRAFRVNVTGSARRPPPRHADKISRHGCSRSVVSSRRQKRKNTHGRIGRSKE